MKKTLVLTLISMAAAATVSAEVLTPAQALTRALGEAPAGMHKIASKNRANLQPALTIGSAAEPEIYVMTPGAESFVILSAESETPALLGYSDDGAFDPADMPPALKAMLELYSYEIKAVRAGIAGYATGGRADYAPILPLCRTMWSQDRPYNSLCPRLGGTYSVTGCVATAMAQVLKVLQWPDQCTGGTETYKWELGGKDLSLNFDDVTLQWDQMKDIYTSTNITPSSKTVAALMQAVGYASHMNYSPSASAASGLNLAAGLVKHFDYDCTLSYEQHEWYTQAEWEEMIYNELADGIPVYYDGVTPDNTMGHAFVVDGYAGDGYFHLNWGWAGMSDGYYRLTALDPSSQGIGGSTSGYNFAQGIIVGLQKGATTPNNQRPLTFYCAETFGVENASINKGKSAKFTGGFYNMAPISVKNITLGVRLVNESTGYERLLRSEYTMTDELGLSYGFKNFDVTIPSYIPAGTYTVYPTVYSRTTKETYDIKTRVGGYGYLIATVEGSKVTFSDPERANVKASDLKLTTKAYPGTSFAVSATVENTTSLPYNGYVIPAIFSLSTGEPVKVFDPFAIELAGSASEQISILCGLESSFETGKYDFCLMTEEGRMAGPALRINVEARPALGILKFNRSKVTDTTKNNLTVEMTVTCTSGYYSGPIYAVIFPRSGQGKSLDVFQSDPILLGENESTTVTISSTFAAGNPGSSYSFAPYYVDPDNNMAPMTDANIVVFTLSEGKYGETAIEEVNNDAAPVEWFDLQGRKIASPSKATISIRRQGDKVSKISL